MIKCKNINKSYGKVQALTNISMEVNKGEIFGLIGPDGGGKTTLFRILTTLILADSGTATVGDFDVVRDYKEIRKRVGYMPGRFSLYQDLTVEENLNFFATVFNTTVEENYDLVKDIYSQIEPFKNRRAGQLSGGMKQKLALSCALIHKPEVLFLDEPTTGVDAVSRKEFWEMLGNLKQQGITILVSTPYMDEASLCDRIALIQNGHFLKTDTPTQIVQQFGKSLWSVRSDTMSKLLKDLRNIAQIESCFAFGDSHHVTLRYEQCNNVQVLSNAQLARNPTVLNSEFTIDQLVKTLEGLGHQSVEVNQLQPSVEDCFMELSTKSAITQ